METKVILDGVQFSVDRETKGTVRFAEDDSTHEPAVGTLYVRKRALPEWRKCIGVVVTIEAVYKE